MGKEQTHRKTIAQNKKAFHDYFVEESLEAGIELCGTEVKSIRQGALNLKDAYCSVKDGELYVKVTALDLENILSASGVE